MTKAFITFFLGLFSLLMYAQQQGNPTGIPDSYYRNSLTVLFVDNTGTNHWTTVREKIPQMKFSDKFDNHNLENLFLRQDFRIESESTSETAVTFHNELIREDIARRVIAKWYNRQQDGTMDMELVHQRGRFTATDADFFVASSTRRGDAALQDLGNRLVNRSFVLILDLRNIVSMDITGNEELRGWKADVKGYLYQIDFNDDVRLAFYETWIYEEDSPQEKERKRSAFMELDIPLNYVANAPATLANTQTRRFGTKSQEQLLVEMINSSLEEVIYKLEREVDEFMVVTPLYGRRPPRAKIGLKEGLRTDTRFFVFEHVYNQRTNSVRTVRRGVIRAGAQSDIHDNRHEAYGDMGTSKFYQVAGRRLQEGYTLMQKNDLGMEILLGGAFGEIGGGYARFDLRTGRLIGVKALFVYVEGGVDGGDYGVPLYGGFGIENFTFLRFGGGIAKGFHPTRNTEFRPYVGIGLENASSDTHTEDLELTAYYFKLGANMAFNLSHNFQFVVGLGSYSFITEAEDENETVYGDWSDVFPGRSGASVLAGVKFMF
ncbi:MAG: hypothetical protein EA361_04325 [Bacteroidetes bacterium]|nr:MAG: hypothetical protein EA361_04325 [Bacteroidota bacterium]